METSSACNSLTGSASPKKMGYWNYTFNKWGNGLLQKPTICVQLTGLFWQCEIQYKTICFAAFHFGEVLLHGEICFGLVIFRGEMMSICYINSAKKPHLSLIVHWGIWSWKIHESLTRNYWTSCLSLLFSHGQQLQFGDKWHFLSDDLGCYQNCAYMK